MISIVIPVLNEEHTIIELLDGLSERASASHITEVIIVDGGSDDQTLSLLENYRLGFPLKIIHAPKGRAKQMNKGAGIAQGKILYFLHADTLPPKTFDKQITEAIHHGNDAGCFRMKFDSPHPVLKISQWFTRFNHRSCRGGDQSLFMKKEVFESLNGYNETFIVYEDCELINRIYDRYQFVVLKDYVTTSARRYQANGTLKLQYHFAVIHLKKWMGASPDRLFAYYQKHIAS